MQGNGRTCLPRSQDLQTSVLRATGVLLLYLLTSSPLAPVFTTLIATTDRSHHVAIQQTSGGIQIVLRHDCLNSPAHRHGLAACLLTTFAQRTTASQPDHVIQFSGADAAMLTPALSVASTQDATASEVVPAPTALIQVLSPVQPPTAWRSPPGANAIGIELDSTVLLI
jgi:hypothetical protein